MKYIAPILLLIAAVSLPVSAGPIEDENLYQVPRPVRILPDELTGLLRAAAQRPDAETRLQTLETIRDYKINELADTVRTLLTDERDVVQSSAIRAADTLGLTDTGDAIAAIVRQTASKSPAERDLIAVGDITLGGFAYAPMTEDWLARLAAAKMTPTLRASAARALGQTHAKQMPGNVTAALTRHAADASVPPLVRFAAADAVKGQPDAQATSVQLMAGTTIDRLVGIRMVSRSPNAQALAALQANARYTEPAVQFPALRHLLDIGASAAPLELLSDVVDSIDPHVRRLAAEGARLHKVPAAVDLAFNQLNDRHPDVRSTAAQSLIELAETDALDPLIRAQLATRIKRVLALDEAGKRRTWGEAEQLARLAGILDHKPVAVDLVGYFDFPRLEAAVAAMRAIRVLDVPETRPPTVKLLEEVVAYSKTVESQLQKLEGEPREVVNAFLAVVEFKYTLAEEAALNIGVWAEPSADPILQSIIPKMHPINANVRAAGIWALGHIHAGNPPDGLPPKLVSRMNDYKGLIPEADNVREQSAVALGRMLAKSQLRALQKKYSDSEDSTVMRYAARWSVGQITGTLPPGLTFDPVVIRETFIAPLIRR